jgi:hypothetical protein
MIKYKKNPRQTKHKKRKIKIKMNSRFKTLKRKRMTGGRMTGGNILEFNNKLDADDKSSILEIGKGGGGVVYVDFTQPNVVFKVSNKNNTCREWNKEKRLYDKINTYSLDTEKCKLVKMISFENIENKCVLELSRVINPLDSHANYTIHPQFGKSNFSYVFHGRGLFLGNQELLDKNIIPGNLELYIQDLAICMARLHYLAQNDGYDIEIFIGKHDDTTENKLFIADFDLSEMIEVYNDYSIDRILWSLCAIPYFPIPPTKEFQVFQENYINEAQKHNKEQIAKTIMSKYVEYYTE